MKRLWHDFRCWLGLHLWQDGEMEVRTHLGPMENLVARIVKQKLKRCLNCELVILL